MNLQELLLDPTFQSKLRCEAAGLLSIMPQTRERSLGRADELLVMQQIRASLRTMADAVFVRFRWWVFLPLLLIWLAWPWLHVLERVVNNRPTPVTDGISSRLDDISFWNITGLIGTILWLGVFVVPPVLRPPRNPLPPRMNPNSPVPGMSWPWVPEFLLVLLLACYVSYGFVKGDNLWRWTRPDTPFLEDAKQIFEGVCCLFFIFLSYASIEAVDRSTRYLFQIRNDVTADAFRRQTWLHLHIAIKFVPLCLAGIGMGFYVSVLGPALADPTVQGWQEPTFLGAPGKPFWLSIFLFLANLCLYLLCIGYCNLLAAKRR